MFESFFVGLDKSTWYCKIIFYPIYYIGHWFLAIVDYFRPTSSTGLFFMFVITFWLIKRNGWSKLFYIIGWVFFIISQGFSKLRRNRARKRLAKTNPNYIYRK